MCHWVSTERSWRCSSEAALQLRIPRDFSGLRGRFAAAESRRRSSSHSIQLWKLRASSWRRIVQPAGELELAPRGLRHCLRLGELPLELARDRRRAPVHLVRRRRVGAAGLRELARQPLLVLQLKDVLTLAPSRPAYLTAVPR